MTQNITAFFHESQQFRQKWLWSLLLLSLLPVMGIFSYALYQQLFLGQPWGDRPLSDGGLIAVSVSTLLFSGGIIWLFVVMRLTVVVADDVLRVRFRPFITRRIAYAEIHDVAACTYHPIREYGGWGIRFNRHGRAYNVSGNRGVRLTLGNGRQLLIGSQQAEALAAAIASRLDVA